MSEQVSTPAGWYEQPGRPGVEVWWDGTRWTDAERAAQPATPVCLWCKHTTLFERELMMNTRGLTFMGWDWANKAARCLVCERCGFIHWFSPMSPPRR